MPGRIQRADGGRDGIFALSYVQLAPAGLVGRVMTSDGVHRLVGPSEWFLW